MRRLAPGRATGALAAAFLVIVIACSPQRTDSSAERPRPADRGHEAVRVRLRHPAGRSRTVPTEEGRGCHALKRVTVFDVDQTQTPISRDAVDGFLAKTGARLWIQHDDIANAKLKKAPDYYE